MELFIWFIIVLLTKGLKIIERPFSSLEELECIVFKSGTVLKIAKVCSRMECKGERACRGWKTFPFYFIGIVL